MSDPFADPASQTAVSQTALRRPDSAPDPLGRRWRERAQSGWRNFVAQLRDRRESRSPVTEFDFSSMQDVDVDLGPKDRIPSALFTAMIAVGGVMLVLGSLWAWQTWSQRSAEPIDDLLPILTAGDIEDPAPNAGAADPAAASVASDDGDELAALSESLTIAGDADGELADQPVVIIVHVSGAVVAPGIVELPSRARVFEAVAQAGGATPAADLDRVNLAAPLNDGERIHVPAAGEDDVPVVVQPIRPGSPEGELGELIPEPPSLIDINAASETELQALPGVGPMIAKAIVQTRNERGPFFTVEELLEVPGIGDAKLAGLRDQAVVIAP